MRFKYIGNTGLIHTNVITIASELTSNKKGRYVIRFGYSFSNKKDRYSKEIGKALAMDMMGDYYLPTQFGEKPTHKHIDSIILNFILSAWNAPLWAKKLIQFELGFIEAAELYASGLN